MKRFYQKVERSLSLEKDDLLNVTKMQMSIWCLDNKTTVVVRLYKDEPSATERLWKDKRTNGDVVIIILDFLKRFGIIKDQKHWQYSTEKANFFAEQDEVEVIENYIYFAWVLDPALISNF
jgi:hypothetical protein